ncbi:MULTISPECIES: FKBP-type peptidyl-prolyl cis-trans isomerase [unclassified Brevundimonas]|uniref:FKBP-type peptidyl-prolyl cis-trans isomerase n=1 Tax=unclassified Brevundimonas TaxID=2622653 RepID=UPI0025C4BC29|nr:MULTISPECIES: FKBP-type peptidyl-prolyl cis-trans isomerase [unclassified Brevundimonas]
MKLTICAAASALTLAALPMTAGAQTTDHQQATAVYQAAQSQWEAGQQAYLQWNAQRSGWTTTESGLQYRRVSKAHPDAAQPAETDTVSVHYRGTLINGSEFDSSYKRNAPASFPLNRVIKGWTEGVALMRKGETFEFVIPADLAYGPRRMGNEIPSNSTLLFTVELLEINP